MRSSNVARHVIAAWLVIVIGLQGLAAQQSSSSKIVALPESLPLSDLEIRWESGGGDGCAGDCTNYRITIRGDGLVTLEDLGWGSKPPKAALRQRSIPVDTVVGLVNELFAAQFLEAPVAFNGRHVAVRKGDALFLYGSGGVGAGWVDFTLRLGPTIKTVRLGEQTPQDLRRLQERIWEIGGPKAWGLQ